MLLLRPLADVDVPGSQDDGSSDGSLLVFGGLAGQMEVAWILGDLRARVVDEPQAEVARIR